MHQVGLDRAGDYTYDVLSDSADLAQEKGSDLRALIRSLNQPAKPTDVLRNGPVPAADIADFAGVYERGRREILAWMTVAARSRTLPPTVARAMSLFVDTHCHLDLYPDPLKTLDEAPETVVVVATELPSRVPAPGRPLPWRQAGTRRTRPSIHCERRTASALQVGQLVRQLANTEYVGEVGLDFSSHGKDTKTAQLRVFDRLLAQPSLRNKVMTVHSRGAEAVVIRAAAIGRRGRHPALVHRAARPDPGSSGCRAVFQHQSGHASNRERAESDRRDSAAPVTDRERWSVRQVAWASGGAS